MLQTEYSLSSLGFSGRRVALIDRNSLTYLALFARSPATAQSKTAGEICGACGGNSHRQARGPFPD